MAAPLDYYNIRQAGWWAGEVAWENTNLQPSDPANFSGVWPQGPRRCKTGDVQGWKQRQDMHSSDYMKTFTPNWCLNRPRFSQVGNGWKWSMEMFPLVLSMSKFVSVSGWCWRMVKFCRYIDNFGACDWLHWFSLIRSVHHLHPHVSWKWTIGHASLWDMTSIAALSPPG